MLNLNIDNATTEILELLDDFYKLFTKYHRIDKIIVSHYFEFISLKIDDYIFNIILKDTLNTKIGLNLKMIISFIEKWYDEKGIETKRRTFLYSREASDIIVMDQKTLITDGLIRKMICPNLNPHQIYLLYKNYVSDSEEDKISNNLLQTLQNENGIKKVEIDCDIQNYYVNQKNEKYFIFILSSLDDLNKKIDDVKLPKRISEKKDFEFLNL
jgi:hypothetical protein